MAKFEIIQIEKGVYTVKDKMPRPIAQVDINQQKNETR